MFTYDSNRINAIPLSFGGGVQQEVIDREFMAALSAEKQQNPQPEPQKAQQSVNAEQATEDVESGTNENWNEEGITATKPIRRKFSRSVPYETAIDGHEDNVGPEESVSDIVLFWNGRTDARTNHETAHSIVTFKDLLIYLFRL